MTNKWNKIFCSFVTKKFMACVSRLTPLLKILGKEGSPHCMEKASKVVLPVSKISIKKKV